MYERVLWFVETIFGFLMCRDVGYRSSFLRFTHAVVHITKKLHERICYYTAVKKWADTYERPLVNLGLILNSLIISKLNTR